MPLSKDIYYFQNIQEDNPTLPLVLIHGAGGSHLNWPSVLRRFPGKNTYAPDLPGHGKSEGYGEQNLASYADKIAAWLTELGLFRAVVIGHSMGGGIALELALRYPHLALGIVLVSTGAQLPISEELLAYTQNQSTFPSALEILKRNSFSQHAAPRMVEQAMRRLSEVRPSVLHNDFNACASFDFTDQLAMIRRPTLVVCGAQDRLTPLRKSQFLVSKIEDATLKIIPEAGHMVMLEKGPELAELVQNFINRLKSAY